MRNPFFPRGGFRYAKAPRRRRRRSLHARALAPSPSVRHRVIGKNSSPACIGGVAGVCPAHLSGVRGYSDTLRDWLKYHLWMQSRYTRARLKIAKSIVTMTKMPCKPLVDAVGVRTHTTHARAFHRRHNILATSRRYKRRCGDRVRHTSTNDLNQARSILEEKKQKPSVHHAPGKSFQLEIFC